MYTCVSLFQQTRACFRLPNAGGLLNSQLLVKAGITLRTAKELEQLRQRTTFWPEIVRKADATKPACTL